MRHNRSASAFLWGLPTRNTSRRPSRCAIRSVLARGPTTTPSTLVGPRLADDTRTRHLRLSTQTIAVIPGSRKLWSARPQPVNFQHPHKRVGYPGQPPAVHDATIVDTATGQPSSRRLVARLLNASFRVSSTTRMLIFVCSASRNLRPSTRKVLSARPVSGCAS